MSQWKMFNGPAPTTAAQVAVTTGTAIKTLLQLATPSTAVVSIKAWGISFAGSVAGAGIECELIETGAVAATVTAHVAGGLHKMSNPASAETSTLTLGTTATGYTATAEGTITTSRVLDVQLVQPTNQYVYQWPLGEWPRVDVSKFVRVRVTAAAAVNAICWLEWDE